MEPYTPWSIFATKNYVRTNWRKGALLWNLKNRRGCVAAWCVPLVEDTRDLIRINKQCAWCGAGALFFYGGSQHARCCGYRPIWRGSGRTFHFYADSKSEIEPPNFHANPDSVSRFLMTFLLLKFLSKGLFISQKTIISPLPLVTMVFKVQCTASFSDYMPTFNAGVHYFLKIIYIYTYIHTYIYIYTYTYTVYIYMCI
jgi:hypothetical protein